LPAPTQFKPKSPYTAFFDRFAQFQEAATAIPEVIVHDVDAAVVPDDTQQHCWFPSPGDVTRYSPEGVECGRDGGGFNLFNAWPGTSMIYKQAVNTTTTTIPMQQQQTVFFKKSITKPPHSNFDCKTPVTLSSMPWSPSHERYPVIGSQDSSVPPSPGAAATGEVHQVKLPKDLSSVLANLGLAKYQTHFEEQDIDLQVIIYI
jgi:hypothetical protein